MLIVLPFALMLVSFAAAWRFRWRDYRLAARWYFGPQEEVASVEPWYENPWYNDTPSLRVSVVVPVLNGAEALEQLLPVLLSQRCDAYEVVVVDEGSSDHTMALLSRYESQYPHLRHTFIAVPESGQSSVRRLSITVGIRSARAPWAVVLSPDCHPAGDGWLAAICGAFAPDVDLVQPFVTYAAGYGRVERRAAHGRLRHSLQLLRAAAGSSGLRGIRKGNFRGRAAGADVSCVAVRKAWYVEEGGHAWLLPATIDKHAPGPEAGRTRAVFRPEARVEQDLPPEECLRTEREMFRRAVHGNGWVGRRLLWRNSAARCVICSFYFCFLAYVILRGYEFFQMGEYQLYTAIPVDVFSFFLFLFALFVPRRWLRQMRQG